MYYPKTLSRFSPKVDQPISLKALASDAVLKTLVFSCLIPTDSQTSQSPARSVLNTRDRRALRRYLDGNLPRPLHVVLFDRAIEKWYGAERVCSLLEVLHPACVTRPKMDLIGPFRFKKTQHFFRSP
jgi:hypothetical protein